ncbi:MAG: hypothetical protein ABJZ55_14340 [Fuerstiella sp.]
MIRSVLSAILVAWAVVVPNVSADDHCPLTGQPTCSGAAMISQASSCQSSSCQTSACPVNSATFTTMASTGSATHQSGHQQAGNQQTMTIQEAKVSSIPGQPAMGGYCPVCIIEASKWEMGSPNHEAVYDGQTYRFPNSAVLAKFQQDPAKYVPALGGDCIVCYEKGGKRVPGSLMHAATYHGRMYLFPSDKEKQMFRDAPKQFANADLAINGACIVCQVVANKQIAGRPEFAEFHNGMRYLFPSAAEQLMFRNNPTKFLPSAKQSNGVLDVPPPNSPVATTSAPMSDAPQASMQKSVPATEQVQLVSFQGMSSCAACSHGVHPLNDPGQLGLAIKTNDGQIIVVEGAHQMAPDTYRDRFNALNLEVTGTVIKSQGNVTWIQPNSLTRR